ncbi:uncharacterized protein LOC142173524 [Nicotiana tabacum]|uniref:Uncharacterized protein LOC142173524 n=1 Tax=Nicotiana tabacum TaxID=4097 RepID=A0AC58TDE3_TOBAC
MEPMQQKRKLERYRRRIGLTQAFANVNNKIWAFVNEDHMVDIIFDLEPQLTMKLTNMDTQISFIVTLVYAKCDSIERIELWDTLYALARDMTFPWLVAGDFVIWDEEEKFGGLPVSLNEVNDFRHCINTCNLFDLGFKGSIYTWWNGRVEEDCIFKRLDRCLANIKFQQMLPGVEITHLSKIGSDHSPMLLTCNPTAVPIKKNPTQENRARLQKVQAELIRYLALEEEFWKQKAGMNWFQDGDRNTKFFHAQVNGRRKRLQLKRIQNSDGNWLEDNETMAEEAIKFYKAQFHEEQEGQTALLVVFFHICWDIIGEDIVKMVKAFFNGQELPRCITHTNMVLLPKKKDVISFSDMRPVSLSNFVNKIFSRVIHERLVGYLPNLISDEQAGFVKGRSIVKNILLTQEIITDIRLRTKAGPNVVIKLDMAKAYDRLS